MCDNDGSRPDSSAGLEGLKGIINRARRFDLKLRSILKQDSKPVNSVHGLCPEHRPEFEGDSQPSCASAASDSSSTTQVSAAESQSRLSSKLQRDSQASAAFTTSKASSSTEASMSGSLFGIFSKAQKHWPNIECPLKCPLKPPTIRTRTCPGPSNLAERCSASTEQLVPAKDLDALSKYWHLQYNFDRLARRNYRQAEEIQFLLRCTKSSPRSIGMVYGNLVSAHRALHNGLGRLHRWFKEAGLDDGMAHMVLDEVETFMERFESLTAEFQFTCQDLQDIFDKAISLEGSLECRMPDPGKVFPVRSELRFVGMCWDLSMAIQPLMDAISCERRKRKYAAPEAVVAEQTE